MTQIDRDPDVLFVVPCDDIRQEITGKFILVGVYGEAFVPATLPTQVGLSFAVWVNLPEPGQYTLRVNLMTEPDNQIVGNMALNFSTAVASKQVPIPLPSLVFMIGQPGALVMRVGREQKEILRLPINAPSNASQPPFGQSQPDVRAT